MLFQMRFFQVLFVSKLQSFSVFHVFTNLQKVHYEFAGGRYSVQGFPNYFYQETLSSKVYLYQSTRFGKH